ncbi:hypothetical protein BD311DRAFT_104838 [Dichomitus squalens]|uniref:Uncharacterized protein n=1 Tax=Dichomitus squalens TaxID=114155 RepID=A0A4Q9MVN6_9APHY|nr:hypothetical protein BD311DRAFT_104838 [Dichomitus squalens]
MGLETAACWATRRGRCRPQSECAVWATNPWTPQADRATSPWNHAASWEHQRPIHPIGFMHDCRCLILPSATLNVTVDEIVEVDKIVLREQLLKDLDVELEDDNLTLEDVR